MVSPVERKRWRADKKANEEKKKKEHFLIRILIQKPHLMGICSPRRGEEVTVEISHSPEKGSWLSLDENTPTWSLNSDLAPQSDRLNSKARKVLVGDAEMCATG
ncbi:hypothetical protein JTE90_022904 [Oedothorax gibbosus]|uniref:Uncharacterized protein n=1 Tax=Oedothorax gibbosus TaxID=931172 RepID=A0AAV6UVF9_9ARAC|nr:hypothetical protein JTE90_022904 [Oedothorax gibbosus]